MSFPELRRGRVGLFIATLLARLHRPGLMPAFQRYDSMVSAYAATMGQLYYYRALEAQGVLRWIKDAAGLDAARRGLGGREQRAANRWGSS